MNQHGEPFIRPPTRLEKAELALKSLIDYAMAMNQMAIQKGLWTMEEFNRAAMDMDRERKVLKEVGHDSGMKIIRMAKDLSEFKPRKDTGGGT